MTHRLALSLPNDLGQTLSELHAAHPYLRQHALLRICLRAGFREVLALQAEEVRARAAHEIELYRSTSE